ncbi:MAG: cell division protein FtsQ/DivIB [Roseimicrobium sp.]
MFFDRLFPKNRKRRPNAVRGNYAFRSRKKTRVRLDVHRLEMNPETDATRREHRRNAMRWGFKFAVAALMAIGLFSAGRIVVREAFTNNQRFQLQHISVATEGELSPSQLIAASGLQTGINMLDIGLVQVRERLEALPQVRHAKVTRGYPGLVFLEVEQRRPVAWLECPEQRLEAKVAGYGCLLDDSGVVLPSDDVTEARRKLPVIRVAKMQRLMPGHVIEAPEVIQALQLLKTHEGSALAHSMKIRRIDASRGYALAAQYDALFTVIFPADEFEPQMRRLERVVHEASQRKWELATVDLLVADNVPLTLRGTPVMAVPEPEPAPAVTPRRPVKRQLARNN